MTEFLHKDITHRIIQAGIAVHRELGPGLLESAYEICLAHELSDKGHHVAQQEKLPIHFRGRRLDAGYRIDLLVDDRVIVEVKAVKSVEPIHEAQLLTYLRLSGIRIGLLMNFNQLRLRDGIKRMIL